MTPRPAAAPVGAFIPAPSRLLVIVPAHDEAATVAAVVADVRATRPDLDVLVVDDGSADRTGELAIRAGARLLRLPERLGVGSAMRAGLRYARRLGYDAAVRVDADGQHAATDIAQLLLPLVEGRADAVIGSRFLGDAAGGPATVRATQRLLAGSLRLLSGRPITDPTSGFAAFGPRAVRLLAEHHPSGYPEPELRLLLGRAGLVECEVAVADRARQGGRSTLTPSRLVAAGARVLLAMLIVPLRPRPLGPDRG